MANYGAKCLYSVWDNRTDDVIAVYRPAREAAAAMGVSFGSFRSYVTRCRPGAKRPVKKWSIEVHDVSESDTEEDWEV